MFLVFGHPSKKTTKDHHCSRAAAASESHQFTQAVITLPSHQALLARLRSETSRNVHIRNHVFSPLRRFIITGINVTRFHNPSLSSVSPVSPCPAYSVVSGRSSNLCAACVPVFLCPPFSTTSPILTSCHFVALCLNRRHEEG